MTAGREGSRPASKKAAMLAGQLADRQDVWQAERLSGQPADQTAAGQ
jgi:hypothetical protein